MISEQYGQKSDPRHEAGTVIKFTPRRKPEPKPPTPLDMLARQLFQDDDP